MSAPVDDEIDVGREARGPHPWQRWPAWARRAAVAAVAVLVVAAFGVWWVNRETGSDPAAGSSSTGSQPLPDYTAPGADTVVQLEPATDRCPAGVTCRYVASLDDPVDAAFRDAFGSVGYIGRQSVVDAGSGEVYWDLVRFQTGALVTVTLSQQPVDRVSGPVVADDTAQDARRNGSFTVTAVRDGYLMMATAAGLPGQLLPVRAAQQWVRTVPAPAA